MTVGGALSVAGSCQSSEIAHSAEGCAKPNVLENVLEWGSALIMACRFQYVFQYVYLGAPFGRMVCLQRSRALSGKEHPAHPIVREIHPNLWIAIPIRFPIRFSRLTP